MDWAGLEAAGTHTHARMDLKEATDTFYWNKRRETVRAVLKEPIIASRFELEYMSKRLPFDGENLGACALMWALNIGHRERMADILCDSGTPQQKVRFAMAINTYKQKMKETISTAEGAFAWSRVFPEDSDDFIDLVKGGKWAFKWAKHIGDKQIMKSRITTTFWAMKYDKEIENNEVSFSSARG